VSYYFIFKELHRLDTAAGRRRVLCTLKHFHNFYRDHACPCGTSERDYEAKAPSERTDDDICPLCPIAAALTKRIER
jgi:hypothetical protein